MRELAEQLSKRFIRGFLILFPVAVFVGFGLATDGTTSTAEPQDDAVAFVLNQSPEKLERQPDAEISTTPTITAAPETTTSTPNPPAPADPPTEGPATQAPATQAPVTSNPAAPPQAQTPDQRGQAALSKITYPWAERLPGWRISFHPERSGVYGYTLVHEKRIEVYVRSGQSDELLAHVVAHEIGHAVDVTHNDGDERDRWLAARGIQGTTWWPNDGASDFSTGAGDFAESFAAWQVGSESFRSKLGPSPSTAQLDVLRQLALG